MGGKIFWVDGGGWGGVGVSALFDNAKKTKQIASVELNFIFRCFLQKKT